MQDCKADGSKANQYRDKVFDYDCMKVFGAKSPLNIIYI